MKKVLLIALLSVVVASPAQAGSGGGHHFQNIVRKCRHPAPLPLAAGLPALALMGGVLAFVRRRRD